MTDKFIYNKPYIVKWASERIPGDGAFPLNSPCIGVERNGELVCAVVFSDFRGCSCCMSVAGLGKRWLSKRLLREAFSFPFVSLGLNRVGGLARADNLPAQNFNEHIGFKKEGVIRRGDDDGCDLIMYGMLKGECRWLGIQ